MKQTKYLTIGEDRFRIVKSKIESNSNYNHSLRLFKIGDKTPILGYLIKESDSIKNEIPYLTKRIKEIDSNVNLF